MELYNWLNYDSFWVDPISPRERLEGEGPFDLLNSGDNKWKGLSSTGDCSFVNSDWCYCPPSKYDYSY